MKTLLFWLLLIPGTAWTAVAFWVQVPHHRPLALAGLVAAVLLVVWLKLASGWGWPVLVAMMLAVGLWYASLKPQADADWAADVARIVSGRVEGDIVVLENTRAFRWTDATTAREAWVTRQVDLSKLTGVDMVTSVWGNPDIAHLLVSFRFEDARPVTFSVEIRREKGEKFSIIGGFFRQFELALVAADEEDILYWRAVPRGEDVRLYPLALTRDQARQVFLAFVALGNDLNRKPQFYNTLTTNCTTVVWHLAKAVAPDLPLSPSLLLSGRLPDYMDRMGALAGEGTLDQKRAAALISDKAKSLPPGVDFSAAIRMP